LRYSRAGGRSRRHWRSAVRARGRSTWWIGSDVWSTSRSSPWNANPMDRPVTACSTRCANFAHDKLLENRRSGDGARRALGVLSCASRPEVCASIPEKLCCVNLRGWKAKFRTFSPLMFWCDQPHVSCGNRDSSWWQGRADIGPGAGGSHWGARSSRRRCGARVPSGQLCNGPTRCFRLWPASRCNWSARRSRDGRSPRPYPLHATKTPGNFRAFCLGRLAYQRAAVGRQKEAGAPRRGKRSIWLGRFGTPRVLSISLYWLGTIRQFQGRFDEAAVAN